MNIKTIVALFIVLVIILLIKPKMIYNLYNTLLGRVVILAVIVFFAMHNATLGLLVALGVIVISNQFTVFAEGLENMDNTTTLGSVPSTVGDDNAIMPTMDAKQNVVTRSGSADANKNDIKNKRISEIKENAMGVDKEDIKNTLASKPSNTLPVPKLTSSESVTPFTTAMLTNKATLTEGMCPCAAAV